MQASEANQRRLGAANGVDALLQVRRRLNPAVKGEPLTRETAPKADEKRFSIAP